MSKAIAVAKPSIESVGAESHQPSPHATKSRKQKLIDAPRQSKHLPTRRPPSMIFSHGRLVSSRLSRRSHPDCRATLGAIGGLARQGASDLIYNYDVNGTNFQNYQWSPAKDYGYSALSGAA